MVSTARRRFWLAPLFLLGGFVTPARAQVNDNLILGGMPDQSVMNGLWFDGYNAFGPQAELGAFAGWWDFYIPPAEKTWNGPYFSTPHWEPYVSRPVAWSGLEYGIANAPPDSTRPHGWYGTASPGRRSDPFYAREFWEYTMPQLRAYERARAEAYAPRAVEFERLPTLAPARLRQYTHDPAAPGPWRAHDSAVPDQLPAPSRPAEPRGFTQYHRQDGRWVMKPAATSAGPRR